MDFIWNLILILIFVLAIPAGIYAIVAPAARRRSSPARLPWESLAHALLVEVLGLEVVVLTTGNFDLQWIALSASLIYLILLPVSLAVLTQISGDWSFKTRRIVNVKVWILTVALLAVHALAWLNQTILR